MEIPPTITCVECGGRAGRASFLPPEPDAETSVVAYLCPDCGHRFDLVFEEADEADEPDDGAAFGVKG